MRETGLTGDRLTPEEMEDAMSHSLRIEARREEKDAKWRKIEEQEKRLAKK